MGKFIIDNAILSGPEITLENTLHENKDFEPKKLLKQQISIPILIKNLEIYKANLFLHDTQIELEKLKKVAKKVFSIPSNFNAHKTLIRVFELRKQMSIVPDKGLFA